MTWSMRKRRTLVWMSAWCWSAQSGCVGWRIHQWPWETAWGRAQAARKLSEGQNKKHCSTEASPSNLSATWSFLMCSCYCCTVFLLCLFLGSVRKLHCCTAQAFIRCHNVELFMRILASAAKLLRVVFDLLLLQVRGEVKLHGGFTPK